MKIAETSCIEIDDVDADRFLPHSALLSFEEIERLARVFVAHGVEKIRLTGDEPLLRKNIEYLIERLALLQTPDGRPLDLTLTTNGSLLARKAAALKSAGLSRVTVSLDALDDALFRRMNDADFAVADVLNGIEAAQAAGLDPIRSTWSSSAAPTIRKSCRWRATSKAVARCFASSNTWTWARRTAGT